MVASEIIVVLIAVIVALLLYKVLKTVKNMVINTIMGLVILVVANLALGLDIAYTWVVILTCALAGPVGAIFIILLHQLGLFF